MEEINEYDKQAQEFLRETQTEFKVEFKEYGLYFEDDKEPRDIYIITLKRGSREYKFNFGQSINASGEYIFYSKDGKRKIHLKRNSKGQISKIYNGEILNNGNSKKNSEFKIPSAYDVLACLQKNEVGTFKDFCGYFGYNEDSIKAEKIYNKVSEEYKNLKMLYTDAELEKMQEIQ